MLLFISSILLFLYAVTAIKKILFKINNLSLLKFLDNDKFNKSFESPIKFKDIGSW